MFAYTALASRLLIGTVFAASAFSKLRSRQAFRAFAAWLDGLPLPAGPGRRAAGPLIAAIEVVIVVMVALPWTARAGLLLSCAVLAIFTAGTFWAVRAGGHAPCRCFGTSGAPLGVRHGLRDALLCAAAAAGAAGARAAPARPAGIAISLGCAIVIALLVLFQDDIVAVLRAGAG